MTAKQKAYKTSLIKQVHCSKKYCEFYSTNREDYKSKLREHFGETSSKELNIKQLLALVDWLNYRLPDLPIIKDRSKEITDSQLNFMRTLWLHYANDTSDSALRGFVKRITGKTYLHMNGLSKKDAQKCIVALKNTLKER